METTFTCPSPGAYQYTYPTFVDVPQYICVHFITPDRQKAFVSYPYTPRYKAAQLIPVSWFKSVDMVQLDGQPQLMAFIKFLVIGLFGDNCKNSLTKASPDEVNECSYHEQLAA